MKWLTCSSCDETFKVVTDSENVEVEYCPYCGSSIDNDLDSHEDETDYFGDTDEHYFS